MNCPFCHATQDRVVDSRLCDDGSSIRRRRQCQACDQRYTTYERYESRPLVVIKSDGSSQPFDRDKLLRGLVRATNKRPVGTEKLEQLVNSIEAELRASGGEARTSRIGELVLNRLKGIDQVAYVRFASVYRDFGDIADFERELEQLA